MALFWKPNISFGLSFLESKNVEKRREGKKRKREEEEEEEKRREEKRKEGRIKRSKGMELYGLLWVYMDFYG